MAYKRENAREKQAQASSRFENQVHAIRVQIPVDVWETVEQYAATKGLTPGQLAKYCINRCMQLDGLEGIQTTVKAAKQAKQASTPNDAD